MNQTAAVSILWKHLDTPGHDACRLDENDSGWNLRGTAVFRHDSAPAQLTYQVLCDPAWRTLQGRVEGWFGAHPVAFNIARTYTGGWTLNGQVVPSLENCVDLDLGFTPATNLLPLRRLDLADGQAAEAPAAWLNVSTGTLTALPQRYERRSKVTYWYEAPSVHYAALLEVAPSGFVLRYPGLWEAES